jgi:type III restriction enzyme
MQGREASKATTIMQKFIKGSDRDRIDPMPVVIGMSATTQRFNKLVENTSSTIHKVVVTTGEVRASGLLKDRIIITYPEEDSVNNDMAILQAAADDWKEKWGHWKQYCYEQHHAYVNPIFIIQVQNGSGKKVSDTDLDDCLAKVEERTGFLFEPGQVVHTFGQTDASITVNGLEVKYVEPSHIAEDKNIRVVFFKENLSTGWDCPRAETMMSFRHATDATYIAQLLGRMIRTPMQMHIEVDEILNDVHLFLPYFNEVTVEKVVEELQNSEGGEIPTDIYGESIGGRIFEPWSVKKPHRKKTEEVDPNQYKFDFDRGKYITEGERFRSEASPETDINVSKLGATHPDGSTEPQGEQKSDTRRKGNTGAKVTEEKSDYNHADESPTDQQHTNEQDAAPEEDLFDREAVMKFINDAGLLSYNVRAFRITNYLNSLFKLSHLLTMSKLHREAITEVQSDIAEMIHEHVVSLKADGKYDDLVLQVQQFKLATQIFDAFGESVDNYSVHDMFTTTDTDLERQFRAADAKLGNEGIGLVYGNKYGDLGDPTGYEIDVILFVADEECMNRLQDYAQDRFHSMNDKYRKYIATVESESIRRRYDTIVSDGDSVSKHNFRLPETIQVPHAVDGKPYRDHLFVNPETGVASIKLNTWEVGVIEEEEKRSDFVCWIRNPSRGSWALCLPYEEEGDIKPTYPDFIIVRRDDILGYVIDILEPHNPEYKDNLGKAKGFAEYARQNPGLGRIQIIRLSKDASGNNKFKRLDMAKSATRKKVLESMTIEELDHIFDTDGFFD